MISERLGRALHVQRGINQQFRESVLKTDTLLHRAEMLLEDDLEFEFAHSCLTEVEYSFLHLYTSSILQVLGAMQKEVTYGSIIRVLQSAAVTLQSVERLDREDEKYNPMEDKVSFLPRKELSEVEKLCFDLIPMLLLYIQVSPQFQAECQNEWWRDTVLTNVLKFLEHSHSLLLKRGLGDRE